MVRKNEKLVVRLLEVYRETMFDFSMPYPIKLALITSGIFPFVLMGIARIPYFKDRNAIQFLAATLVTSIFFGIYLLKSRVSSLAQGVDHSIIVSSIFIYFSAWIVYFEAWALLSRGYTLGLLLTLFKAKSGLNSEQLGSQYRGGEGLEWLIKHRFAGLMGAKLIKRENDQIFLTNPLGIMVATFYRCLVKFFGLNYTG